MIKNYFILLFLLTKLSLYSQLIPDTIDYNCIKGLHSYKLAKVTSGIKNEVMKLKPELGTTYFILNSERTNPYKKFFTENKIKFKDNDTLMYFEFDMEKTTELYNRHQWGVVHLNNKANVLMLDKISIVNSMALGRIFKIYKLTETEIILKDISNKELNRIYYLIKQ